MFVDIFFSERIAAILNNIKFFKMSLLSCDLSKYTFKVKCPLFYWLHTIEYCVMLHVNSHYWPFAVILNK